MLNLDYCAIALLLLSKDTIMPKNCQKWFLYSTRHVRQSWVQFGTPESVNTTSNSLDLNFWQGLLLRAISKGKFRSKVFVHSWAELRNFLYLRSLFLHFHFSALLCANDKLIILHCFFLATKLWKALSVYSSVKVPSKAFIENVLWNSMF